MKIKCVIWDLDNTLWDGILGEDPHVTLKPGVKEVLEELDRRGVLQSIASRNDEEAALAKMDELGIRQLFLYPQCNWSSKVHSIRRIVKKMNIGMDTVAYIDDSPFELFEINTYLPKIHTYKAEEYKDLLEYPEFWAERVTSEGARRREMMIARQKREEAREAFTGSREDFLKTCRMQLSIRPACEDDLDRIVELALRTNQLNNMLDRIDDNVVQEYLQAGDKEVYTATLKDRFGDHGMVGVCFLDFMGQTAHLRLFYISCRVEGRGLGFAFLSTVIRMLSTKHPGLIKVYSAYKPEKRNRPALMLLKMMGFKKESQQKEYLMYRLDLPHTLTPPLWIEVREMGRHKYQQGRRQGGEASMDQNEIEAKAISIVMEILGEQEIHNDTILLGEGGILDSLTVVQLISRLEEEFGIELDDEDLQLESLSRVDKLICLIKGYVS